MTISFCDVHAVDFPVTKEPIRDIYHKMIDGTDAFVGVG